MTDEELMKCVATKLSQLDIISLTYIQQRYRTSYRQARECIWKLKEAGRITDRWDTARGGWVVKESGL